jgi:serine/threonine-protein kinase RsbT
VPNESRVPINSDADLVTARQTGRALAIQAGFNGTDLTVIATAISELARNIVVYAKSGEITLRVIKEGSREGLEVIAHDNGPGIADVSQAMQVGFSTGNSLGLGLPGAKRLMDELHVESRVGKGTTVTARKWRR